MYRYFNDDVTRFKCRCRDFLSNRLPPKQDDGSFFFLISSLATLKDTLTAKNMGVSS